ncbi:LOW QUALITY PROTEIN: piggyBac transposable element-derived protein 4-like [Sitodiplosis mosellana]|uniref:LOW QUALITY PROTEIN: piggyBac transposable element-derived protein 4-like n=1 Tax=Sitodiplosis mosellana TaxID=263140 RepID=UPI0024437BF0|nr:LOW QUALITY PROTEIN: piggyBac transposable element-derived protein 4-like [Sitodiplosis mosellana]
MSRYTCNVDFFRDLSEEEKRELAAYMDEEDNGDYFDDSDADPDYEPSEASECDDFTIDDQTLEDAAFVELRTSIEATGADLDMNYEETIVPDVEDDVNMEEMPIEPKSWPKISYRQVNESGRDREWKDTNSDEVYALIGILLHCGAEKANSVQIKDLFHESHMPFYRAVMSLERCEQLLRFLRFDNTRSRLDRLRLDKLAPIRFIWDKFLTNLTLPFIPSKELCTDEQLLVSRNRCSFRQYIPSKPGKYGIKIFWLVDSKLNYPVVVEVYLGTQPNEKRSTGIAHALVMRLAERHLDMGVNITVDNFFSSIPLAQDLYQHNTTMVGTIRSNKRELPWNFTSLKMAKERGRNTASFCFSGPCELVNYKTKTEKNVLLLSTAHASEDIDPISGKPLVVHDYNSTRGGVDTFDQMLRGYTCKRKTNRWPMVMFFNM